MMYIGNLLYKFMDTRCSYTFLELDLVIELLPWSSRHLADNIIALIARIN